MARRRRILVGGNSITIEAHDRSSPYSDETGRGDVISKWGQDKRSTKWKRRKKRHRRSRRARQSGVVLGSYK